MSKYHDLSLLTRVAINLAKKDITVRLRQPCIKNIGGLAMARPGGCTIDLDPDMSDKQFYWTYLHEVAHAKNQAKTTSSNDWIDLPPGYFMLTKDWLNPIVKMEEDAANKQAVVWDTWAESWGLLYDGATEYERKLKALLNYAPGLKSFNEMVYQAAQRGAEHALKIYNQRR